MPKIRSLNTITVKSTAERVWKVIADVREYPTWWPAKLKIKLLRVTDGRLGSQIEVRPYGGLPFCCEFAEVTEERKLVLKYSGAYSGRGEWRIEENNGMTSVEYEIELDINSQLIRALSHLLPIERIHHRLMGEVLEALSRRVDHITNAASTSANGG